MSWKIQGGRRRSRSPRSASLSSSHCMERRANHRAWITCAAPSSGPHAASGGSAFSVVARLISGRALATVTVRPIDPVCKLRSAVIEADNGQQSNESGCLDLVFGGRTLADGELTSAVGLSEGSELLVVRVPRFGVLVSCEDHRARLFDGVTGNLEKSFGGHKNAVKAAVFSPDGSHVLTASDDFTARLFTTDGFCQLVLRGHRNNINSVCFSPDGVWALTGSDDGNAGLFDVKTGQREWMFRGHANVVNSVVFSPDGNVVLTASDDRSAKLFDMRSGTCVLTLKGHSEGLRSAAFSSETSHVLTASEDGLAMLFDARTGSQVRSYVGHEDTVRSVVCSPDGGKVLTASQDCTAKLFDFITGDCERTFKGHTDFVCSAVFSPDGGKVLTASDDRNARVFNVESDMVQRTYRAGSALNTAVFRPEP